MKHQLIILTLVKLMIKGMKKVEIFYVYQLQRLITTGKIKLKINQSSSKKFHTKIISKFSLKKQITFVKRTIEFEIIFKII